MLTASDLWMTLPRDPLIPEALGARGLYPPFSQTCLDLRVTAAASAWAPPGPRLRKPLMKRWGFCRSDSSKGGQRGLL